MHNDVRGLFELSISDITLQKAIIVENYLRVWYERHKSRSIDSYIITILYSCVITTHVLILLRQFV